MRNTRNIDGKGQAVCSGPWQVEGEGRYYSNESLQFLNFNLEFEVLSLDVGSNIATTKSDQLVLVPVVTQLIT